MNKEQTSKGQARWEADFAKSVVGATTIYNRSGVGIRPLYTPQDTKGTQYEETLGYPGQYPYTRGIYATMYRGRSWSQRQLIGLGVPEDYNLRVKEILELGASALSLIPCNSVFRGYDADEVPSELLGTCGTVINHVEDMGVALDGVPIGDLSTAMNDPSPFTLLAFELGVAKRRGVPWSKITGTSNQSDCISHFVANHMFFRLALQGARRVIVDHIAFVNKHVPGWNHYRSSGNTCSKQAQPRLKLWPSRSAQVSSTLKTASQPAWTQTSFFRVSPSFSTFLSVSLRK